MANSFHEQLILKNFYIRAGKSVMEHNRKHFGRYVNHLLVDETVNRIKQENSDIKMLFSDKIGTFFDKLCHRLIEEVYNDCFIIVLVSPYFSSDLICGLIVPCYNSFFVNTMTESQCKATKLYTNDSCAQSDYNSDIAFDFFQISEKI